jgi:hypothetical protein
MNTSPNTAASAQMTSGVAIASLILSITGFIPMLIAPPLGLIFIIAAIVCGHLGRSACNKNQNLGGRGLALAGLIIGYSTLILLPIIVVLFFILIGPQ